MNNIDNFIGVFPNVVSPQYCDAVINHFDWLEKSRKTLTRQQSDNVSPSNKKNTIYRLETEHDLVTLESNSAILSQFVEATWKCYHLYNEEYGTICTLDKQQISYSTKIQKTKQSEGYHVWHCEHAGALSGRRLLLVMLYLNDVEEGGETEFLYQSKRVQPKQGTVVICPAGFTHTHRGNPPLSGTKYMINTWIEYI